MLDLRTFNLQQITKFLELNQEKPFRAKQIYEWIWKKYIYSIDEMTNLPISTRELLTKNFKFHRLKIYQKQVSKDQTIKIAFKLIDGEIIESVLIPSESRSTVCISTQVGCQLKCKFCATGKLKFRRNLFFYEIYDQVFLLKKIAEEELKLPLTNIVIMGMGEPLQNYENTLAAIEKITSNDGMAMSPQRITLSTAGIAKEIIRLADDDIKFQLAISLHTANNLKRTNLMPVNKSNSLDDLIKAIKYFYQKIGSRITYEYLLLYNFNDSIKDAKELAEFCKISPCKINLIEYNSSENSEFKKSEPERTQKFKEYLESKNLIVNIRKSKGDDIDAACGQLANKFSK